MSTVDDRLKANLWPLIISEQIENGVCDSATLTDQIFFGMHPERSMRPLDPSEPNFERLMKEWIAYRDFFVTPQLSATCCHRYRREFADATKFAGVSESWASDHSLCRLIKRESGWNPFAKNKSSGAFGLFQMLKLTWKRMLPEVEYGTPDVFWQAVGGFRYIRKAYGSPKRAWEFWKATVRKDPNLAPKNLRRKAKLWISKGFYGY